MFFLKNSFVKTGRDCRRQRRTLEHDLHRFVIFSLVFIFQTSSGFTGGQTQSDDHVKPLCSLHFCVSFFRELFSHVRSSLGQASRSWGRRMARILILWGGNGSGRSGGSHFQRLIIRPNSLCFSACVFNQASGLIEMGARLNWRVLCDRMMTGSAIVHLKYI